MKNNNKTIYVHINNKLDEDPGSLTGQITCKIKQ